MNTKVAPNPDLDATLSELAALGMRAARVVARLMEIEQAAAEAAARWLPATAADATSLSEAVAAGQGIDAAAAALAEAVPRVEALARAFDRVSRSVRRSVALLRRMQAGWPGTAAADDRHAMLRRQVAQGVAEVIRRDTDGEAAERLFDDLAERLDDPVLETEIGALPVEEVVRRICRDLGLGQVGSEPSREATVRSPGQRPKRPLPDTC